MRINITKDIESDGLVSHIVLNSMSTSLAKRVVEEGAETDGVYCDVKVTVNGTEIDLMSFVEHWQSQVDSMISAEAARVVTDKFADISDILYDLEGRVKTEIDRRLEDWEKP